MNDFLCKQWATAAGEKMIISHGRMSSLNASDFISLAFVENGPKTFSWHSSQYHDLPNLFPLGFLFSPTLFHLVQFLLVPLPLSLCRLHWEVFAQVSWLGDNTGGEKMSHDCSSPTAVSSQVQCWRAFPHKTSPRRAFPHKTSFHKQWPGLLWPSHSKWR